MTEIWQIEISLCKVGLVVINPCTVRNHILQYLWWRHQIETFSTWLAICAGNSPVPGDFPAQRPVTRSVSFDLRLNKRLSKQSWGWWFETLSRSLWRHPNVSKTTSSLGTSSYLGVGSSCFILPGLTLHCLVCFCCCTINFRISYFTDKYE